MAGTALARLLVVLAVMAQLAGAAAPMPGRAPGLSPGGAVTAAICHAGGEPAQQAPAHQHQESPCFACCLMHGGGGQIAILGPTSAVPGPRAVAVVMAGRLPGARAPPPFAAAAPYPRGPPTLA